VAEHRGSASRPTAARFASSSVTTSKSAAGTPRTSGAVLVAVAIGDEADLQPKALASSFYEYAA
jgi:hypothetical protein